jgi:hypothetical protein
MGKKNLVEKGLTFFFSYRYDLFNHYETKEKKNDNTESICKNKGFYLILAM